MSIFNESQEIKSNHNSIESCKDLSAPFNNTIIVDSATRYTNHDIPNITKTLSNYRIKLIITDTE